jgi:ATP-dependent Lon protease
MVFTFNDISAIDPILLDRLTIINTKPLTLPDKLVVARKHLIPELSESVGMLPEQITLTDSTIQRLIEDYTAEAGARQLKQVLRDLIRELNLRRLCDQEIDLEISDNLIQEVFSHRDKTRRHKIPVESQTGQINGMYANALGMGGVLPIQVSLTKSESSGKMELTGMQGDVMKESMICARTMAWELFDQQVVEETEKEKFGLHIHCPSAATPKDGPSAGGAICLAIFSALSKRKIKNTVAMTGEMDLRGRITAIGGLGPKLTGAKAAGVKLALIPKENHVQMQRLRDLKLSPEDDDFKVIEVETIHQAKDYALE